MSTITRVCLNCQRPFEILPDEVARLEQWAAAENGVFALPKRCRDCRADKRHAERAVTADTPAGWLVCWDCSSDFYVSADELELFFANGWNIPKRCVRCRGRRRKRAEQERAAMP